MSAVLFCIEDPRQSESQLQFEWISEGKVEPGPWLAISLGGELDEQRYSCRVSNAASNETTTFIAKDCNTDTGRNLQRSNFHCEEQSELLG